MQNIMSIDATMEHCNRGSISSNIYKEIPMLTLGTIVDDKKVRCFSIANFNKQIELWNWFGCIHLQINWVSQHKGLGIYQEQMQLS